MWDTTGGPERARWLHLACSGSQSQRAIWFILPARGARHIIRQLSAADIPKTWTEIQELFTVDFGLNNVGLHQNVIRETRLRTLLTV